MHTATVIDIELCGITIRDLALRLLYDDEAWPLDLGDGVIAPGRFLEFDMVTERLAMLIFELPDHYDSLVAPIEYKEIPLDAIGDEC